MLRNIILAIAVAIGGSMTAEAGVIVTYTGTNTVGLPGFMTWTLTASSDNGAQIVGFDFASQPSYGFFGPMNQVNPFGQPTIFADNNAIITGIGGQVSQDSQFKFLSSAMTVPAGFASESSTQLRSLFASAVGLGTSVQFAQIATSGNFNGVGQIQTQLPGQNPVDNSVSFTPCLGCFPPQIVDATINNVNANSPGFVEHTVQFNGVSGSLGNFAFDSFVSPLGGSGTGPATPATLNSSTRKFNWNTVGSPLGTYKWTLTATNSFGTDTGSITVNIAVPEPASVLLLCAFLVGTFGFTRRRN